MPGDGPMLDISLASQKHTYCNGWSRRDFLRVGAVAPLGLSLGGLLAATRPATAGPLAPASAGKWPRANSVLLVFLGGGISHHDSFDMKTGAVEEIRGKYQAVASDVPGLRVCELLPRMAKTMRRVALIRSQQHGNDHHETATNWVLSGKFG